MTAILGQLGFKLGRDLLGAHACNLRGLWENEAVVSFNEEVLASCGSAWFDPSFLDLDEILDAQAEAPGWWQCRLQGLLRIQYPESKDILIKDPRVSRMHPMYQQALEALGYRVRWVIALRHPSECADSLYQRDGIPRPIGYALWISHTLSALHAAFGGDAHILSYEALLSHPEDTLRELTHWVHEGVPQIPVPYESMKARIDPQLRHSRRPVPPKGHAGAPLFELAETIFQHLLSETRDWAGRAEIRDWEARYRELLPSPGWCRGRYRLVFYQPPGSFDPAVSAALSASRVRPGILLIRDGGDDVPLDPGLNQAMITGQLGVFYNLSVRDESASLVRGVALRAGRGILLLQRRAVLQMSRWLDWLDESTITQDRVLTWGGTSAREPEAVFVPDSVAARVDPWASFAKGTDALQAFLAALRSLEGCAVEYQTRNP